MATEAQCGCTMRGLPHGALSQDGYWEECSSPGPCYQRVPALALSSREHELWVSLGAAGSHFITVSPQRQGHSNPSSSECLGSINCNPRGLGECSVEKAGLQREQVQAVTQASCEVPIKLSWLTDSVMLDTFPGRISKLWSQIIMPLSHATTF